MLLILLIFLFILALAAFLAWPELSLYALAISLPVIGWNFSWHNFTLPLVDLVAVLALIAFFLRLSFQLLFKRAKVVKLKWPMFLPFAIFIGVNFISALLGDTIYSLWYLTRWLLLLYFGYIFLPYNLITSGRVLKKTVMALVASTLIVLLSGYLSFYGQDWRDSFFRLKSISILGIFPFGDNQNLIAEFLNVGAFLILALKDWTKNLRAKRLWDVAFILTALGIIMTFSRAGWITLTLQLVIYAWYRLRNKVKKTSIIFGTLGLLILLVPLGWKMTQLQQDNTSSTENRLLLAEISWQAFLDKPYFGYGSGQFINLVADNIRFTAKYGAPLDSHGILQKVIAETGAFGLAALFFIMLYLLQRGYRSLKLYYRDNNWILSLWLAGAGGLFFQFFNTSYYKGKVWLPLALALAATRLLEAKYGTSKQE